VLRVLHAYLTVPLAAASGCGLGMRAAPSREIPDNRGGAPGQHSTGIGFTEVGEERRQGHAARRRPPMLPAAWS